MYVVSVDFPRRVVHGGTGKLRKEKTREPVLDFSASVNPFPPVISWNCDPSVLSVYPDDSYCSLKERIGRVFHREPEEICVGNGSIELIRVFCWVTLRDKQNSRYHITPPTFGEYELSAQLSGGVRAERPEDARVRFVCNPNNPTGLLLGRSILLEMLADTRDRDAFLFVDEAFIGLSDPRESMSGISDPNLFVLHSLTKSFAVPGLRIGFGFGDPDLIEKIETARSPWCVNAYAESFALEALLHLDELAESRERIVRERDRLVSRLSALGLTCMPSSANFLLVDTGRNVAPLCADLAGKKILVRDCTSFGLPTCFRIAVRTPEENTLLLSGLESCVH